jgi:hypothetical protein
MKSARQSILCVAPNGHKRAIAAFRSPRESPRRNARKPRETALISKQTLAASLALTLALTVIRLIQTSFGHSLASFEQSNTHQTP